MCKNFALHHFPAIFLKFFSKKTTTSLPRPRLSRIKQPMQIHRQWRFVIVGAAFVTVDDLGAQLLQRFQVVVDRTPAAAKAGGELSRGACGFAPDQTVQAV
jgi:hypothetical protein